ncbi:ethanolamine utilization protein EutN [Pediococcus acidilactici]|nr:ethanolamine utilization protein EutN [Pediococcus acidilactici]
MVYGKVVGSVVSTQKDKSLVGRKLMIVRAIDSQGQPVRPEEVAVDSVGAGIGEYVLLVRGAGARIANHADKNFRDVSDCAIVGIIDSFDK